MRKDKETIPGQWFRMALSTCGVALDAKTADLIFQVAQAVTEKGDLFSIHDAAKIITDVENRNPNP